MFTNMLFILLYYITYDSVFVYQLTLSYYCLPYFVTFFHCLQTCTRSSGDLVICSYFLFLCFFLACFNLDVVCETKRISCKLSITNKSESGIKCNNNVSFSISPFLSATRLRLEKDEGALTDSSLEESLVSEIFLFFFVCLFFVRLFFIVSW